ncbi:carboxypeptidase regulatory-like domain-containing protein [Actinoallomurus sp. NBC_01490]|uniref:carboxypeptidase regulatory-like domain-containing protein n=1 Tax=Actinoallomurus sp. NBC_01490 TaxID=2903557 RepID=UPI002E2F3043|nr:carboxypeptidase regulatory-like domain-containing protein [Actinoallomurus sp. NBC_01490]
MSTHRRWRAVRAIVAIALAVGTAFVVVTTTTSTASAGSATSATGSGTPYGSHAVPAGCNTGATADDGTTPLARCHAVGHARESGALAEQEDEPLPTSLGPADIRSAYALPDGGAGRTVAIVDAFGYDNAESDLAVFRAHYGLPPCTTSNGCFTKVDQRGGTDYPRQDEGWSIETALDLDAVSSACPKCHILLVQADDNASPNLGQAVDTAASLGAVAISNSYGVDGEIPFESRYDHYYDHPGIAVTVSTGDNGNVQSYPATYPNVVAVGGTTLTRDASSPRGWHESAWADGGSGCSRYEPRPDYQRGVETGCPDGRATADVAADADSETGLAVYNTLGQDGWAQWGGTSLASPLVAAMYALAGTPVPGSYPVTYLYRHGVSLNDVTEGAQGGCGDVRCTAGPGWDGPTGVGTPKDVSALTLGAYGHLAGTVTGPHKPLAGAALTFTDTTGYTSRAVTDDKGRYQVALAAGTYTVVASKFGYRGATAEHVAVTAGGSASRGFSLPILPTRTVTGTVTDGSGQGWPVYAKITIDGYPYGAVHTDPFTGRYAVELPVGTTSTLRTEPADMPGYAERTTTVAVAPGAAPLHHDVTLAVDAVSCTAAGYAYAYDGAGTGFEGWSEARDGWKVTDDAGAGKTWVFDDPGARGNMTGGGGGFAIVDNWYHPASSTDTSLTTPALDLSAQAAPTIGFDTYYYDYGFGEQEGDVDLSLDGGSTWRNVWHAPDTAVHGHVDVPIPQAAGHADVRVRFRFSGGNVNFWELDNAYVGTRSCAPTGGGLVAGVVGDDNTGGPLTGAEVAAEGGAPSVSHATPEDAALGDGFYWLFSAGTGRVRLTSSGRHYASATASVDVAAHRVARVDWRLRAGRVTANPGGLAVTAGGNGAGSRVLTLTNRGTRTATVGIVEQDRGFTPAGGHRRTTSPGAPPRRVSVDASASSFAGHGRPAQPAPPPRDASVDPAWSDLPEYPTPVMDNVVAESDGIVYSVAGVTDAAVTAESYAYDPAAGSWHRIADLPAPRENAVGGFVGGRLYVAGGWDPAGNLTSTTFAYDPAANRWSRVADLPTPSTAATGAAVGNRFYVVSGCRSDACDEPAPTYRYDPGDDAWTRVADYPEHVVMAGCAGSGDGLICAGGLVPVDQWHENPVSTAYRYVAGSDAWTPIADMPYAAWGASYAGADGKLQMVGGIVRNAITNQGVEFDPATGAWSALPNAKYAMFRGGAACGLFRVGGSIGDFLAAPYAERLPGQGGCVAGADVGWLATDRTEVAVPPGRSVTVRVSFDTAATSTRGTYAARLAFVTDTPYTVPPVDVTLKRT